MSKQTAVEWLEDQIFASTKFIDIDLFQAIEQAKAMEKEQHGNTWDAAIQAHEDRGHVLARSYCDFDDYFNETYGGDND
jgi:hypothetical protein